MKTMKLAHGVVRDLDRPSEVDYKVIVVKNSTAFHPGQILTKAEVDDLIEYGKWDITVVSLNTAGAAT